MIFCMGCMEQYDDGLSVCPHCGYVRGTAAREGYHMPPESILHKRYIVGRVLGFGGFGVTYIGWDAQLERKIAIKEFLPSELATRMPGNTAVTVYGGESTEQFQDGLVRFVDEAQRLAKFNGLPGIVDIYDSFAENNTGYIIMQFLEGRDVKGILNSEGPIPYEKALPIILSVANTLEQVHAQGIIHRDIAPDNIFITNDGGVKLLDFGAARYESALNSKSLSVILKSGYAPEEQYRSHGEQGSWTDVYALAATFYKMLTGVTPEDSMERSVQDELKEPSKHGFEIPKSDENAIMNALNIRAADRTQTMAEFASSFKREDVQRTKIKQTRKKSSRFPTWLKITVAGAITAGVVYAILGATGTVRFGGLPEGSINTPGLINRMIEEAESELQSSGLKHIIAGKDFNDRVEEGLVFMQEPMPGQLIEIGGTVSIWVSGGSTDDLDADSARTGDEIDPTKIPDLTFYTYEKAADILGRLDIPMNEGLEYSDTVEAGLVISYSFDEEDQMVWLTVSVGPEPTEDSEIAPPVMMGYNINYVDGRGVSADILIAAGVDSRVNTLELGIVDPDEYRGMYRYSNISNDDHDLSRSRWYVSELILSWLNDDANDNNLNYESYDFQLMIANNDISYEIINSTTHPVVMRVNFPDDATVPEITGFTLTNTPVSDNEYGTGEAEYIVTGNFQEGKYYSISAEGGAVYIHEEIECITDGELIVTGWVNVEEDAQFDYLPQQVQAMECIRFEIDDDSQTGVMEFSRIGIFSLNPIDVSKIPDATGLIYADAVEVLAEAWEMGVRVEYDGAHSNSVPGGTVISQEYDEFLQELRVIISAGPELSPGEIPKPIVLGLTIEPEWNPGDELAPKFRTIIPQAENVYLRAWYRENGNPEYEWRDFFSNGFYPEHPDMVNETVLSDNLYDVFYNNYNSYDDALVFGGDIELEFALSMIDRDAEDGWLEFDETLDSRKVYLNQTLQLTITEDSFITGIEYLETNERIETYEYDGEVNEETYTSFTYGVNTIFGDDYVNMHNIVYGSDRYSYYYANSNWTGDGLRLSFELNEYSMENLNDDYGDIPRGFVFFHDNGYDIRNDGVIHLNISYDKVELPSTPGLPEPTPEPVYEYGNIMEEWGISEEELNMILAEFGWEGISLEELEQLIADGLIDW